MTEALIKSGALVIDVRSAASFKKGHARNAVNIPLNDLLLYQEKIKDLSSPVVCCCEVGKLSEAAVCFLNRSGFSAFNAGSWVVVDYLQSL